MIIFVQIHTEEFGNKYYTGGQKQKKLKSIAEKNKLHKI
jgi:hypothetical protein